MRLAALALVLTGCAAIVGGMMIDNANRDASALAGQYAELQALRLNAGLTKEQYWDEMAHLDPEYVRARTRAWLRQEAEKRKIRGPLDSRPIDVHEYPPDLRKVHDEMPKGESRWGIGRLLYRARRLEAGATETDVLAELKADNPNWKP